MRAKLAFGTAGLVLIATTWILLPATSKAQQANGWSYYDANGQPYGGLRDPHTGLVWGFNSQFTESADNWTFAMEMGVGNACLTYTACTTAPCDYAQFSNCFWNRDDSDWRLPTKTELIQAVANGVFQNLDYNPAAGFDSLFDADGNPIFQSLLWSSTSKTAKLAWEVDFASGNAAAFNKQGSVMYWVPVRGPVAP